MNLDDTLRDTLADDRWALPVPADTLSAVRRKRARRQRTRVGGAVLATAGMVTGGVLVATALPGSGSDPARSVIRPLSAPEAVGCAAPPAGVLPGSNPPYTVKSARDWFMSKAQSDAFFTNYNQPSPRPDARVPSPQPSGPGTDRLLSALEAAGVPGTETLDRDEADSGDRGSYVVKGALADGRQLNVYRQRLLFPMNTDGIGSDGSSRYVTVEQVPGTGCAALVFTGTPAIPGSTGFVSVVTPDGLGTAWNSATIPMAQLKAWAYAAAQWETTHPAG